MKVKDILGYECIQTTVTYDHATERLQDAPEVAVRRKILSSPNTKKRK